MSQAVKLTGSMKILKNIPRHDPRAHTNPAPHEQLYDPGVLWHSVASFGQGCSSGKLHSSISALQIKQQALISH